MAGTRRGGSVVEAHSIYYKNRIESYFPVALAINVLIVIAYIIYDHETSEDNYEEIDFTGEAREAVQTINTVFNSVTLVIAAAGGFAGYWFSHRDAFTVSFITSMSLSSSIQIERSVTYELMVFRGFALVSCLVVAWMAMLKSRHLQDDRHRKTEAAEGQRTGSFFGTDTVAKLSYAAAVAMVLVAPAKLTLIHYTNKGGDDDPSIWEAGRLDASIIGSLTLILGLAGVYGTYSRSRLILMSCAVVALVTIQMANANQAYYAYSMGITAFMCDCSFFQDLADNTTAWDLECPEDQQILDATMGVFYIHWVVLMVGAWCFYTLSERLQSGLGDGASTDNQNAWYNAGDHSMAQWREHFVQIFTQCNTYYFSMIVASGLMAALMAPLEDKEEHGTGGGTFHARFIIALIFLTPGFIATNMVIYKVGKGSERTSSEEWALASTVFVLYASGLCYFMSLHSYLGAEYGVGVGTPGRHVKSQIWTCPDISFGDITPCQTAIGATMAAAKQPPPPGAPPALMQQLADSATLANSSKCQAVAEFVRNRKETLTFGPYDWPVRNALGFTAILLVIGIVLSMLILISVQGLDEASQDESAASGDERKIRQSVMHGRQEGSVAEDDTLAFSMAGAEGATAGKTDDGAKFVSAQV
jgi:hypothetical protein